MLIDEGALSVERFQTLKMPIKHWVAMEACLVLHNFPTDSIGDPPDILVIPAVRTFRMHDLTLDSLLYATDSTFMGEHWSDPTVGYALMRSNLIVVTSEYRHNKYTLRHEALHFMLWRQAHLMGHPVEYFNPCDRDYDE